MLKLTFLGTGTSTGVPIIGCDCPVCQSPDAADKRYRSSVLLRSPEMTWIVDTGPDFRSQALRCGLKELDAVLITHAHTDHIMGFDDLRRFTFGENDQLPVYAPAETLADLRRVYDFAFSGQNRYAGYFKPEPHVVTGPFCLGKTTVTPLPVLHGRIYTTGYHFQYERGPRLAYIPDCKLIPDATLELLADVDVLIVDGLRYELHPTHFSIQEALDAAAACRARHTWLTHLSHSVSHASLSAALPRNVSVAYDTLEIVLA